ncbi:protein FAM149B1 isoform X2 [Coregonus clupeaformis]|uniref:protein FAM149B1 isoform X2 n=1 Tax=Coregonus clupeaformis TaxID=59861 RepID=UPI001BE109B0|nr:protein FAM149B1 isoform X2 [Coregonus clupeaformis]
MHDERGHSGGHERIKTEKRIMISRYSRRPVSHNLEIRGLSRSSLDHHPLPEEVDDDFLPQRLLHDLQEAVSTYNSSETTSAASRRSDCPTATTGDTTRSWSGIHSYTGTGISTERSSVFSWGYDEFDKAASRQVQQMFEEIDDKLYEGRGGAHLRGLQDECHQWAFRFPHLRIQGSQLVCPSDEGFQWYATSGKGTSTASSSSAGQNDSISSKPQDKDKPSTSKDLCVQGRKAMLSRPSADVDHPPGTPSGSRGHDRPRVIEAEGLMEEYLAFDCRDMDDEWERGWVGAARRRNCLPPVSPYRCRKQAVLDLLFDDVWRELFGWMEELVRRHWEGCVSDYEKNAVNFSPSQSDAQNPFLLLSTLPTLLPRLGQSMVPQLTGSLQTQTTKSRGSKYKPRRKSKMQKKPSTVCNSHLEAKCCRSTPSTASSRLPVEAAVTHHNLNELIVIHGIPLQQRNLGVMERAQDPEERLVINRPGSTVILSSKPRPRRVLEQSSSSLSRPAQSARRRNLPPRTLLPLVPSLTQSSATRTMDEVIRGTRLPTASDRLASPPMPLSRNTLLPPIGTGEAEPMHSGQHFRPTQRHRDSSSRAHSAVTDEAGSLLPRDRLHQLDVFSRPNTTHTYRSDTPYRRSFTVLDNIGQGRPGRASVGTDSLGIGVTGISLGISSSSFLDSFTHHPLGHSPIEDEEEPDTQAPPPALLVPVSVPASSHSRGGFMARSSRPGL